MWVAPRNTFNPHSLAMCSACRHHILVKETCCPFSCFQKPEGSGLKTYDPGFWLFSVKRPSEWSYTGVYGKTANTVIVALVVHQHQSNGDAKWGIMHMIWDLFSCLKGCESLVPCVYIENIKNQDLRPQHFWASEHAHRLLCSQSTLWEWSGFIKH